LKGVDKLLFISSVPSQATPRLVQHTNVVRAAGKADVKYIAYTSFPHADTQTIPLAQDHKQTEKLIESSGFDYSFLRNNWYIENEANFLAVSKNNQPFVYSAGDGKTDWALEREYAEAAADVLLLDAPKKIYKFASPTFTYHDLGVAVQKATGNYFEIKSVSDAEYTANLESQGVDGAFVDTIIAFQAWIREGTLDVDSTDLPDVLGT